MIRFANGMDSCGILDEWMNGTKKTGAENPMGDDVLERNKNLNRGFRKLKVMNPFGIWMVGWIPAESWMIRMK